MTVNHPGGAIASVVIPAHNEESVVGRCLDSLLADARPGEFEVVVVANGCSDGTVAVASSFAPRVEVVELGESSKIAALNAGDAAVVAFPRAYLDADVELSAESLRAVVEHLERGEALSAAPTVHWNLAQSPWGVRAFYRAFLQLPFASKDPVSGVYVLSETGRRRFGEFPDLIADDLFVRNLFSDDERATVAGAGMVVQPPRAMRSLVAVRRRVYRGNAQYAASGRSSQASSTFDPRAILRLFFRDPIAVCVFLAVNVAAKLQVRLSTQTDVWERDDSTRG